jgi:hypothetical protein
MNRRAKIISLFVIVAFAILLLRLFQIQVLDDSYKRAAQNNVLRKEVQHPPRGEVYDRNGELLVRSIASYDLMAIPRDVGEFDTLALARIAGVTPEKLKSELDKAARYSRRRPSVIVKQMSLEAKLLFDEGEFSGFYTVYRTMRSYPRKMAGNLLGYISEVDAATIARDDYYQTGDYRGMSGIERTYEEVLRGEKGMKVSIVDVHGIEKGPYMDGAADLQAIPGTAITTSLDARLQALGEELMEGKVGSIIAIEPATGEILVMVSSPGYDPDELVGRDRGNNYMKLLANPRRPLFNRGVMSRYPPGSTFKLVNGLIALQEGEEVPLTDALYATMMASANDGANLLAEYVGEGTIADGVAKMNARVEELGLAHTHFANPHGISDEDHYTSCYDMAQILRWALEQPGFEQVFTRNEMYTMQPTNIQPVTRYFSQQDKMRIGSSRYYISSILGSKLGYTNTARYSYACLAEQNGIRLICVTMQSELSTDKYNDMRTLLDYAFSTFTGYTDLPAQGITAPLSVVGGGGSLRL